MDNSSPPRWHDWEATYRGAAAIALGGIPLLLIIPAIHFCWVMMGVQQRYSYRPYGSSADSDVPWAATVMGWAFLVAAVFIMSAAAGIRQGLLARDATVRTREPRLLPNIGLRFSLLSLIGWFALVAILLRWFGELAGGW
jgi:hypothetical protein